MLTPQQQPNRWSCMATAFAIALGIPVEKLVEIIGHDGSEIISPAEEPHGRRGFSAQECIDVALSMGFACTQIELLPALDFPGGFRKLITFPHAATSVGGNWTRFTKHVSSSRGVIAGNGKRHGHAVAYENRLIYDPAGTSFHFTQGACEQRHFYCQMLWRMDRITP
jgi:hypothetical protein